MGASGVGGWIGVSGGLGVGYSVFGIRDPVGVMWRTMRGMSRRLDEAFALARERHQGQVRKGSAVPYISHPMIVAGMVMQFGGDEEVAMAALLHDVPEDAGGEEALEEIRQRFGDRVARLVLQNSDTLSTPKPPWLQRKQAYLDALWHKERDALLISLCDKTHNAMTVAADLEEFGPSVWDRFRGAREGSIWYYEELHARFSALEMPKALLAEMARAIEVMRRY